MRVCIIGGGPSGLFLAKELLKNNMHVHIYEKENKIGGLYTSSFLPEYKKTNTFFSEILNSKNIKIFDSHEIKRSDLFYLQNYYHAIVFATGSDKSKQLSIKGSKYCMKSSDITKWYNGFYKNIEIGNKICIIGMGDVSFDIVRYLLDSKNMFGTPESKIQADKVKSVTVIGRSTPFKSSFNNYSLSRIYDIQDLKIKTNIKSLNKNFYSKNMLKNAEIDHKKSNESTINYFDDYNNKDMNTFENPSHPSNNANIDKYFNNEEYELSVKKHMRRKKLLNTVKDIGSKILNLNFGCKPIKIEKKEDKYILKYNCNNRIYKKQYDTVISSIGNIKKNISDIKLKIPIFRIGWCVNPNGNLSQMKESAEIISKDILKELNL
ncbi:putative pyrimidine nucleotide-disulfide oxidoreductase [Hamiltosporidium tvaerminnensis]|uniref:Putative pyrimidine nucleotide-disulfide oxidoreductase n=1 Tax=Hamiltosporidium tvaerminnensis TaxID=1176355 RepID=A0A4Q9LY74_9MICR|nr:hypothetical protein LUQ84_000661 [Hamiltosporidium tvaerminnensis]TBU05429.1 putative pyrimidine nucleotide-disulfide oxidoreductase [Hamiltosporidium tvaerminnensis]TBU13704.1 putative pyrimidine nucleotide-disulfide oxidoreductase [Hamiltosporidium tvaerminnensis]